VADPPAEPSERATSPQDDPQPLPGTSSEKPLESAVTAAPHSALAQAADVDAASARAALNRGRFLAGATIGVGAVMSAVIAVPALGFVLAPVFKSGEFWDIDLGPTSNFPVGDKYTVVTFEREPNDTSGIQRRVAFVRQKPEGTFTAISNTCMHLGCPVRAFTGSFGCPCHGGQYDAEGRRTAGPPVRPLNRFLTKVVNGHLILGELMATESVDANGKATLVQLKGPGQPVDGILSFLYPDAPQ
jgi:menaquinol-cytochrome c reductase iron-sulfur subunit